MSHRMRPDVATFAALLCLVLSCGPSSSFGDVQVSNHADTDLQAGLRLKLSGIPTVVCNPRCEQIAVKFSIDAEEGPAAPEVSQRDVEVSAGDQAVSLPPNSLHRTSDEPAGVIIALDVSGSMRQSKASWGARKVDAARNSIQSFLQSLQPGDRVGVLTFDRDITPVFPAAGEGVIDGDRARAAQAVAGIQISNTESRYVTALYDAIDELIKRARTSGAHNVLVVTDGMDNFSHAGDIPSDHGEYVARREQAIQEAARAARVRVFAIGIGDVNAPPLSLSWVDTESLQRVATATGAGQIGAVDLADLDRMAADNNSSQSSADAAAAGTPLLQHELNKVLAAIRESLHYDYELTIPFSAESILTDQAVDYTVKVTTIPALNEQQRVSLAVGFDIVRHSGQIGVTRVDVKKPETFLVPLPKQRDTTGAAFSEEGQPLVNPPNSTSYWTTYATLLAILAALAAGPLGLSRWQAQRVRAAADRAVEVLDRHSAYIGKACPNEGRRGGGANFDRGDRVVVCPGCRTPHHLACWVAGGQRCWVCRRETRLSEHALAHIDD